MFVPLPKPNSFRWKESLLLALSLFGTTTALAAPRLESEFPALSESWQAARQNRRFQVPDTKELLMAKSLFERVLAGEKGATMAQEWQKLGFEWVDWHGLHLLRESPARNEGRGFFLFRPEPADEVLIQIPHGETDERTGELGIRLALEGNARAVAWNTVPRRVSSFGSGSINADLAHLEQSLFIALTEAFTRRMPQGLVVQLHGFSQEKRRSTAGMQADLIVSAGHSAPGFRYEQMVACMRRNGVVGTKLYPREINELGGETNSIGKRMRALGMQGFLHLEMSRSLRDRLAVERALRAAFYQCLAKKER
ncbi:MAG: hypothetical protein H7839_05695 [Magnetococcus sp. YQC-5]